MRIENNSNVFISTTNIVDKKMIGTIPLPDFTGFHFNTKSTEIIPSEAIVALAQKDHAAGQFHSQSAEYLSLRKRHLSSVSPDRKAIITEGLTVISQKPLKKPLQLWELLYGKVSYEHEPQQKVTFAKFYDSNGDLIATYSSTGQPWDFFPTHAEKARSNEFLTIYNNAWSEAERAANNT